MRKLTLVAVLLLAGCLHNPCRVQSAKMVALAIRASDDVEARVKAAKLTPAEALQLLEAHNADAKMGFPTYQECVP
jgi:hypothetical protein